MATLVSRRFIYYGSVCGVILLALLLRLNGHSWDDGWYMHPDERHVVMVMTDRLHAPSTDELDDLLHPSSSPLNTRSVDAEGHAQSFAYGSLPLFITEFVAAVAGAINQKPLNDYGHVGMIGRFLTALLDVATIVLAMAFARRTFGRLAAIITGLLLVTTVLLVQLAHFFTVDTWVTFFSMAVLYASLRMFETPTTRWSLIAGGFFGLALATKVSVVTLGAPILMASILAHRGLGWSGAAAAVIRQMTLAAAAAVLAFATFEPYAIWAPEPFIEDALTQWRIVTGRFDVPFTRQFVGVIPVRYELGNLIHWGLGPAFGVASLSGVALAFRRLRGDAGPRWILLSWVVPYFIVIASAEAKFMRYSAPLVPTLALLVSAWLAPKLVHLKTRTRGSLFAAASLLILLLGNGLWVTAFESIYREPHTRVAASEWIFRNIPPGATITSEYWDDPLPLPLAGQAAPGQRYHQISLDLYADRPNQEELDYIASFLREADYIILSSDRLAHSIPRLPWRYPVASEYYRLLENGQLGYQLVYESDVVPRLGGWRFDDSRADESFTVYDHPRVRIFEKVATLSREELERRFAWGVSQPREGTRYPSEPSLLLDRPVAASPAADDLGWSTGWTSHSLVASALWIAVISLFGLTTLPVTLAVFARFADKGWGFARAIGLIVCGYAVWISVSLRLIEFRLPEVLLIVLLVSLAVWFGLGKRTWAILSNPRLDRKAILASEVAFLCSFVFFLWLRSINPDLWQTFWGGEKPMEMSYIGAVARSATFPPLDPWYAHGVMNYYYYGFYLVSLLWKITGIPPEIGFQLGVASIGAMLVSSVFSLSSTAGADLLKTSRLRWVALAGGLGVLLHTFVGNLDAVGQFFGERQGAFDFWQSSRVVDFTITEFPYFTQIWADLHPHAINLPFTVLIIALAYARLRAREWNEVPLWIWMSLTALVVGTIGVTNSWDMPLALVFPAVALVSHALRSRDRRLVRLFQAGGLAIILGAAAFGLFWPFFGRFVALVDGVARTTSGTTLPQYLVHFGLFLGLLASVSIVVATRRFERHDLLMVVAGLAAATGYAVVAVLFDLERGINLILGTSIVFALGTVLPLGAALFARGLASGQAMRSVVLLGAVVIGGSLALSPTRSLLFILVCLGAIVWYRFVDAPAISFVGICLAGAAGVTLVADVIYVVDDLNGSPWERMNTVFKFYLEAWTLFALAAAITLTWLIRHIARTSAALPLGIIARPRARLRRKGKESQRMRYGALPIGGAAAGVAFLLLIGGLFYPVLGTPSRLAQAMPSSPTQLTLNGLAWMRGGWIETERGERIGFSGDLDAIRWLRANANGNEVVLEASIGPYRGNGARIVAGTGLPSVLGWDRHERQQRYLPGIDERLSDVRLFYTSADLNRKREILDQYQVRYIIVGDVERYWRVAAGFAGARTDGERYATDAGIDAIQRMVGSDLRVAFSSGSTTVYEVRPFPSLPPSPSSSNRP